MKSKEENSEGIGLCTLYLYLQKRGDWSHVSKDRRFGIYSMNKIRSRQLLFVARVNAAAQGLLSTCCSPCFGVKIDDNYTLRRRKLLVRNPFSQATNCVENCEGDWAGGAV